MKKKNIAHIILYSDEFNYKTWCQYCDIVGCDYNSTAVKIVLDKSLTEDIG
jgi:hypothetical protein